MQPNDIARLLRKLLGWVPHTWENSNCKKCMAHCERCEMLATIDALEEEEIYNVSTD